MISKKEREFLTHFSLYPTKSSDFSLNIFLSVDKIQARRTHTRAFSVTLDIVEAGVPFAANDNNVSCISVLNVSILLRLLPSHTNFSLRSTFSQKSKVAKPSEPVLIISKSEQSIFYVCLRYWEHFTHSFHPTSSCSFLFFFWASFTFLLFDVPFYWDQFNKDM